MAVINDTENVRAGLTKQESQLLASLSEAGKTIFSTDDIVTELGCSRGYAWLIANRMKLKRWIIPVVRGKYLIAPLSAGTRAMYTEHGFVIASYIADPYYIGYWSALNHYGFTEQVPFTVFVATPNRLRSRQILNVKYKFVTLTRKKFFGFARVWVANAPVNISDKEKTIVDALDHPEYSGGITEVAKCLWNARRALSWDTMLEYATRMGNNTILRRLGYLSELLDVQVDEKTFLRMQNSVGKGYSLLDPAMPDTGSYMKKWKLILNVSDKSLLEGRRG